MPFVYEKAGALKGKPKVGTHECVALIQEFLPVGSSKTWVAGARVIGSAGMKSGTAIATFRNGKYLSDKSNNHAAFFLRFDPGGFFVVDQWKDKPNRPKRDISVRFIPQHGGPNLDGSWPYESDNADAFFVIEKGAASAGHVAQHLKKAAK